MKQKDVFGTLADLIGVHLQILSVLRHHPEFSVMNTGQICVCISIKAFFMFAKQWWAQ